MREAQAQTSSTSLSHKFPSTNLQSQGKMKFYILFFLAGIIFHSSECIKIKLELQRNILNFGYGINYKYGGDVGVFV